MKSKPSPPPPQPPEWHRSRATGMLLAGGMVLPRDSSSLRLSSYIVAGIGGFSPSWNRWKVWLVQGKRPLCFPGLALPGQGGCLLFPLFNSELKGFQ